MLMLSRGKDEQIVIGSGASMVTIMVVDVRGGKVRLGIEAPKEVPVHRKEVFDAIQRKSPLEKEVLRELELDRIAKEFLTETYKEE